MHLFDKNDHYLRTQTWFAGTTANGADEITSKAQAKLFEFIMSLGEVTFEDISVELFSEEVVGQIFGLIDASVPAEGYKSIHLLPCDIAFFRPFDGTCDGTFET